MANGIQVIIGDRMAVPLEKTTEREFRFCFRKFNLFSLHGFYNSIRKVGGEIELVSEQGVRWRPADRFWDLKEYFSGDLAVHLARIKGTAEQCEAYMGIFSQNPDYVTYFNAPLVEARE